MIHATSREPKKALLKMRKDGKLPAIIYGHGFSSLPVFLNYSEFKKVLLNHGEGGLFDVTLNNDKAFKVLIQDYQIHPIKQEYMHVDLYHVRMDEKLRTKIPIVFTGEAPAVKSGGVLVKNYDHIEVECFPQDLISDVKVPLTSLQNIHDAIKVADLDIPEKITVLIDKNMILAAIAQMQEEELEITKEDEKAKIEELGKEPEKEVKEAKEKEDKTERGEK